MLENLTEYQKAFNEYQENPTPENEKRFLDICDQLLEQLMQENKEQYLNR